jgi:hypothetical protein
LGDRASSDCSQQLTDWHQHWNHALTRDLLIEASPGAQAKGVDFLAIALNAARRPLLVSFGLALKRIESELRRF